MSRSTAWVTESNMNKEEETRDTVRPKKIKESIALKDRIQKETTKQEGEPLWFNANNNSNNNNNNNDNNNDNLQAFDSLCSQRNKDLNILCRQTGLHQRKS